MSGISLHGLLVPHLGRSLVRSCGAILLLQSKAKRRNARAEKSKEEAFMSRVSP